MSHSIRTLFIFTALLPLIAAAADPLHMRIDQMIADSQAGPTAPLAGDAEFLRRSYLDFTGTIPSIKDTRAFLADTSPNKRAALVDRLLASPRYVRHMTNMLDVMLMERRADKYVKAPDWQNYLQASIEQNKPYNQLAAELLGADGSDEKTRPATKFLLDREMEPNLLTREVSRMFFGRDFECNQCHDHPIVDDYLQSDFYGVYAFLQRSYLFQPDKKKPALIAEKAEGAANFKSVFTDEAGTTRPRLPGGEQIAEPTFAKGEEWQVKADPKNKNLRPIPKFSRREALARLATNGENDAFNQNIANRLWAHMMGRGLIHPVDLHHTDNPPTHPELLKLLGDDFAAMKFDMKVFLREVALSQTYQRSFQLTDSLQSHLPVAQQQLQQHEAKLNQFRASINRVIESLAQSQTAFDEAKQQVATLPAELEKANAETAEAQKQYDELTAKLATAKSRVDEGGKTLRQIESKLTAELLARGSVKQQVETLKALIAYGDKAASTSVDMMMVAQRTAELKVARQAFEAADAELAAARNQLSAAQTSRKAATKSLADANTQLAPKRELAKLISEASTKTEAARQQQADDKEVVAVAAAVKAQSDKFNKAVAVLEKTIATHQATIKTATEQMGLAQTIIDREAAKVAKLQPKYLAAQEAFEKANAGNQALDSAYDTVTEFLTKRFAMAAVQPMSPEQMTWSVLEATGMADRQRAASAAEINKKTPLKPEEQKDPTKIAAREREIEIHAYDKQRSYVARFVKLFAAAPGQPQGDFFATVEQALFFANGGEVRSWLAPSGENLTARMIKLDDPRAIAEEMYLSVLTRRPSDEEIKDVTQYLASRPDERTVVVQEMAWALLTSIEFRFQH